MQVAVTKNFEATVELFSNGENPTKDDLKSMRMNFKRREYQNATETADPKRSKTSSTALIKASDRNDDVQQENVTKKQHQLIEIKETRKLTKPKWHPPWKLKSVLSGHTGWVRCVAVDSSNEWFATGAGDRIIKVWDMASGTLKVSLTGHVATVRGLAISDRHPYLFSAGEDKQIKCWDLEYNKVIRQYHGHLSGIYCLTLHPTLDLLVTGGRDSTARVFIIKEVWDMRTKNQVFALTGHMSTVPAIACQPNDPQIITGSADSTIKLWDLAAGKTITTLTHHKKGVRALALNPIENSFVSGAADNIKQWMNPRGDFVQNLSGHHTIINSLSCNQDNVLFSGG